MYRFSAQSYTQKRKQPNFYFLFKFKAALGAYDRLPTSIFNKKYRGEPFTLEKDTPLHFSAGPVSRVLSPDARVRISVIYLRRQSSAASSNLPPTSDEQPSNVGVHGLATYGTYGRTTSLPPRWALTPPFHPYRSLARPAVVLCYAPIPSRISSRLACVVLCVARTFLSRFAPAATERACGTKVSIFRRNFSTTISFYFLTLKI